MLIACRVPTVVPIVSGFPTWRCWLEGDPENPAVGAPLPFVLASLLGYEPFEAPLPEWLVRIASELELEIAFAEPSGRNQSA
jgi:hypothetical protein